MKILIVAPMPPQPSGRGAIPLLLDAQVSGLRERNEVTFVSAVGEEAGEAEGAERLRDSGLDAHFADRRLSSSARQRWRRRARMAGEWAFGARPWRAIWFADPAIQAILDRLTLSHSFDVAVIEDSAMSSYRLPPGVPSLLTEHEVLRPRALGWRPSGPPAAWPNWAFTELDYRKRPPFQRSAWNRFDRVLAFGGRDAASIAELAPEVAARVRVSPFGISLPPLVDPAGVEPDSLLFVGNFSHQPNRDAARWLAREIMPALLARHPAARLRIVGSAPTPEVLALDGGAVEVIADAPSIEPYMAAAAVVLAPVRTGGGMRMKVLEALASGKAVVTTSRGAEGFTELDPEPPLVIADDAAGVAAATAALLADPSGPQELGRRAAEFARAHYSPAAWAQRLEQLYEETREHAAA